MSDSAAFGASTTAGAADVPLRADSDRDLASVLPDGACEWLETDGLGGFASGTVSGIRTRRYHGLLIAATTPPAGRTMLVNGVEAWIETAAGRVTLFPQRFAPGVLHPQRCAEIISFTTEPWPRWTWRLGDGSRLEHELFVPHGAAQCAMLWRLRSASGPVTLHVRPLISGRDYHALHHENPGLRFDAEVKGECVRWRPYGVHPPIEAVSSGAYRHEPVWYRQFLYEQEQRRGFDCVEDLASPGVISFDLVRREAALIFRACEVEAVQGEESSRSAVEVLRGLAAVERLRRSRFAAPLDRAADAYLAQRGSRRTIIAGYPWFADWGRDTFIAMRGLCIASGRLEEAESILLGWAETVSRGMLPNRFPDSSSSSAAGPPEFNSVDASLWYVIAVHEFFETAQRADLVLNERAIAILRRAVCEIVTGYAGGTRYGIRADDDGLLAAGERGEQLTWMDARVGDREITPRIGKPVEVQALWINALWIAGGFDGRWKALCARARAAFARRFWNDERGCLYDVVDVDHAAGAVDASVRPNQIFAVGGLPLQVIEGERARAIVSRVERDLLTPLGLRSLAPHEAAYTGRYEGGPHERDAAYHQGTVWPWLLGPFVEAWVRMHGDDDAARRRARQRFLEPLMAHLNTAGLGHISEIADAEPPHEPRGCPFQAWSLGELLRLQRSVLADQDIGRKKAQESQKEKKRRAVDVGAHQS